MEIFTDDFPAAYRRFSPSHADDFVDVFGRVIINGSFFSPWVRLSVMLLDRPSVLPSEALQGLFEVFLGLPRPSEPSEGLLLGFLRFPEALRGSRKPTLSGNSEAL